MRSCSSCSGWPSQASWQAFRLSLERRPHPCSRCRARAAAAVALCVSALISGVATVITCIARHKALSRLAGAAVKQMAAHDGRDVHLSAHSAAQTPIDSGVCELGATRSNVLERSAAQHGAGKALRHQRRGCAVLRRSAAGALGTSDRASRAAVQVPLGRLALASFGKALSSSAFCVAVDANQRRNPVVNGAVPVGLRKFGRANPYTYVRRALVITRTDLVTARVSWVV